MNKQTTTAFKTLKSIYGVPEWANSPSRQAIEDEWDKALENFSEEQVKKACLRYAKYKHTNNFPPLACIEAELVDEKYNEDNQDKVALANKCYAYAMEHRMECDPVPTELTIKQTLWRSYGVAVGGFDPERDGTLE